MDGSSNSGYQRSENSRLNSSVWDMNPRLLRTSRSSFSGSAPHGSEIREDKDRIVLNHIDNLKTQVGSSGICEDEMVLDPYRVSEWDDISLRQWLDKAERVVDAVECLHIFRQIVEIVNVAHSQGINVHNVRPSCFVMSSFNRVSFIESASCSDSSSDSFEDEPNSKTAKIKGSTATSPLDFPYNASRMVSENSCMQSKSFYANRVPLEHGEEEKSNCRKNVEHGEEKKQSFPMKQILLMETNWYTSPEEIAGSSSSCASDIYRLGVLLFELYCPSSLRDEKSRTMSSLRHRVLPPQLLLKWPKEASFCLWLLHPEPTSRPPMGELIQSEFLSEARVNLEEREAAIDIKAKIEEQDLLLDFLLLIQQRNQEAAKKLQESVSLLSCDIEEVSMLQTSLKHKGGSYVVDNEGSANVGSTTTRKRFRPGDQICSMAGNDDSLDTHADNKESSMSKQSRVMKNFKKLEAAYFLSRRRPVKPSARPIAKHSSMSSDGKGSVVVNERSSVINLPPNDRYTEKTQSGWINPFLEGLCKYLSFSKLKVKADLNQGDLLNSSNLVCSLSFDRDGQYFATAGVNKKIKVFECDAILKEDRDIHYPVVEMASRSKLSSICWNSYIKSQIASSNFEGVVQLWDVTRNQVVMEMKEHERRVWSIDFSLADPTLLASGSDDGCVKLWSINQGVSVGTIKTKANVCCVQFPSDSGRYLAFGSADHKIYYYDLRNSKLPLCTLIGHNKTVSYVKFVDSMNLVSASTDNTVKLWDLSMCSSRILDSPLQSFTGHTNVKNFVGLSVSDGYIATGSETNEVFIYQKAFPMPALSYKFNTTDPLSGHEMDDAAQFISSVCWRSQSSTLVAANSTGNIKILEMV